MWIVIFFVEYEEKSTEFSFPRVSIRPISLVVKVDKNLWNHIPTFFVRNVAITYMADSLRNEYRVRLMNSCTVTFFGFVYNPTTKLVL